MNTFKLNLTLLLVFNCCYLIAGQKLNKDVDCKCRLPVQSKIVGGSELKTPVPWSVSLAYSNELHFCGGKLSKNNKLPVLILYFSHYK